MTGAIDELSTFDIQHVLASQEKVSSRGTLQERVHSAWLDLLSHHHCSAELVDAISQSFGIDSAVVIGWVNLNGWPRPEDNGAPNPEKDEDRFGVASETIYHVSGIDRRMDRQALRDMAIDPLCAFWSQLRTTYRRPTMTWLEITGTTNLSRIDLSQAQSLLNRFPMTLTQLAGIYCASPALFEKFAASQQVTPQSHPGTGSLHTGRLIHDHEILQRIVVAHAQDLYYHYAIPVHRMADKVGLPWDELWAYGVVHGAWQLPHDERMAEIEWLITNHKV